MGVFSLSVCGCGCILKYCSAVLSQDTLVKQNLIRSMDLIGRSLHINHLKKTFVFNKRVDLFNHLLVSGGEVAVSGMEHVCMGWG